jgi:DNA primase
MIKFSTENIVEKITPEEIFKRTTEYDIYSYYMPTKFKIGSIMSSPFHEDKHPSFGIFKDKSSNALLFKDIALDVSGDCIKFVRELYRLTYKQALERIWDDIIDGHLIKSDRGKYVQNVYKYRKRLISVKRKYFTSVDDDYWGQYGIDRDTLKKYNVSPISMFWVDDFPSSIRYTPEQPIYAYRIFNSFKIYNPLAKLKKDKWRSNCGMYDIQGWEQLPESGDLLVITKSLKDVMTLSQFNIVAIAPQAEGQLIPEKVVDEAKKRFKRLVMLYDYDDAGVNGANKAKQAYEIPTLYIPKHYLDIYGVKDVSDFIKEFGKTKTKALLKELKIAVKETKNT